MKRSDWIRFVGSIALTVGVLVLIGVFAVAFSGCEVETIPTAPAPEPVAIETPEPEPTLTPISDECRLAHVDIRLINPDDWYDYEYNVYAFRLGEVPYIRANPTNIKGCPINTDECDGSLNVHWQKPVGPARLLGPEFSLIRQLKPSGEGGDVRVDVTVAQGDVVVPGSTTFYIVK